MIDEERIAEALQALRTADDGVRTGTGAQARAVLAFRRQHRRRGMQRLAIAAGVVLMGVLGVASYQRRESRQITTAQVNANAAQVISASDSKEILTQFFPLMPSAPRLENGLIIRVTVPASVMQRVGLPVSGAHLSDSVQAEILVGQDSLARAIRFVTYR